MINAKIIGMLLAAFIAGSFVASPELRAYAADTIRSGDIVDGEVKNADIATNAVTTSKINDGAVKTADIGDGEVKAVDIARDAVGASEIAGVSKLIFKDCEYKNPVLQEPTMKVTLLCPVSGSRLGDMTIATVVGGGNGCFGVEYTSTQFDFVYVVVRNHCNVKIAMDTINLGLIVFSTAKEPPP